MMEKLKQSVVGQDPYKKSRIKHSLVKNTPSFNFRWLTSILVMINLFRTVLNQNYTEINKEVSSPPRQYSSHYPTISDPIRIPFTVASSLELRLFEVGNFGTPTWTHATPAG